MHLSDTDLLSKVAVFGAFSWDYDTPKGASKIKGIVSLLAAVDEQQVLGLSSPQTSGNSQRRGTFGQSPCGIRPGGRR